mgnify:CR=1 FL=1
MMISKILIAVLLTVSHAAGAIQMSGTYSGDGDFNIRSHVSSDFVEARGTGDTFYSQQFTVNRTRAIFNFDGKQGFFSSEGVLGVLGLAHSIRLFDADNITVDATIDGNDSAWTKGDYSRDYTQYNVALNGSFQEDVYDAGKFGRPDNLLQVRMEGVIDRITSNVRDDRVKDPTGLNITEWIKE